MFDKYRFAKIIKNIKETYNSQEEFSEKSGIGRTYLSQYMNMKLDKPPKPEILEKLANASNDTITYNELMQICGYVCITELTPTSYNIGAKYWQMIFGDAKKVELSKNGSIFFSSFLNKLIERANNCKLDDDFFEINFSTDLILPKNCTSEELAEYNRLASFIICSLINSNTISVNDAEKEELLNIVQKQLDISSALIQNINSYDIPTERQITKQNDINNDFRYASHNGINIDGLDEKDIEEINRYVEYVRSKKKEDKK